MSSSGYLIGIDGGGSKTAVALTDACLNLVLLESFPRSNPGDIGADSALLLIHDACLSVLSKASVRADEVIAAFAGIAGGSAGHFPNRVVPLLEEILPLRIFSGLRRRQRHLRNRFILFCKAERKNHSRRRIRPV